MDPAEDPSKGGAAAPPVIHYHVYNISQVENVQIGTDNVINKIGYEDDIVDAPPSLEMPTVSSNVQPGLPPDVHPQLQLAGRTCPVTGAMGNTNPPPITPNITPSEPQHSPSNGATPNTSTTDNGSSNKPQASPPKLDPSLHIGKMPFTVRLRLTSMLSVKKPDGKDWRLLVEKLGFEPHYVSLWDQRKENPAETLLQSWAVKLDATVGRLHALLLECDMGDIAEIL
ncbi:PREDICTED: tumor necrosis factor receptor superfamily member 16-like [Branchiostoma belcheri]|uniref:Tumor necrosis factor receptor superfamily member 16-like n=1 Tax=Branchiostoma belcheri TaxID=7741 RepID=A0A6P5AEN5_BRABE|nr:PREDICTED: tumor necrosis factor receptor superfamily member 16-like [Branchiostoma belcheri]